MEKDQNKPGGTEESSVCEAASNVSYAPSDGQRYTYADYMKWDDDQRWELIDGVPFLMSAPTWQHQEISSNLHYQLYGLLKGKSCKVYAAPFDVRLNAYTHDNTVVQPDLLVLCDRTKLDKTGCKGTPDLVIEIVSPSTSSRDRLQKFNIYRQSGVREYWIVEPDEKKVSVHVLSNEDYITRIYDKTDSIPIRILDNSKIDLTEVFE